MSSRKNAGPRMEPRRTPVLAGYSSKKVLSRTIGSCLLLREDKEGQIPEQKFHKTYVYQEE